MSEDKPILLIDLNGALLKRRPFKLAHHKWFELFSVLLNKPEVKDYANMDGNYFPKVHKVMKEYLGDVDKATLNTFARHTYAMATIAEVKKEDVVEEFKEWLEDKRVKYAIALVTSAPSSSVDPILEKIACKFLFHIVHKSPVDKQPNKIELVKEFIQKHGQPAFYIGRGDDDLQHIKDTLNIPTVSVNWVEESEHKGDYDVQTVQELKRIIE